MKPERLNPEAQNVPEEEKSEKQYSLENINQIVRIVGKKFEDYFDKIRDSMKVEDRRKLGNILSNWKALTDSWSPRLIKENIKRSANDKLEEYFKSEYGKDEKKEIPEDKKELLDKMKQIFDETLNKELE